MSGSILCTFAEYQLYTRDTVTVQADVDALTIDAEKLIAEKLERVGLSDADYTERLRIFYDESATGLFGPSGWVYPTAPFVASVATPAQTSIASDGLTVRNVSPDADPIGLFGSPIQLDRYCTLTYHGGWTALTVPVSITIAIARVARNLQRPMAPGEGAMTMVRQGDSQVTYGGVGLALDPVDPATWRSIKGWRKRQVT